MFLLKVLLVPVHPVSPGSQRVGAVGLNLSDGLEAGIVLPMVRRLAAVPVVHRTDLPCKYCTTILQRLTISLKIVDLKVDETPPLLKPVCSSMYFLIGGSMSMPK